VILDKLPKEVTPEMANDVLAMVNLLMLVETSGADLKRAKMELPYSMVDNLVGFAQILSGERKEARSVLKQANRVLKRNDRITIPCMDTQPWTSHKKPSASG
jgi:hypothetical protein